MLLKCCLFNIDMILLRHAIFCKFVFMSASMHYIILSFIVNFNFIAVTHIISLKQQHLLICTILPKVVTSGGCLAFAKFLANFSLALLVKMLLLNKRVIT